MSSIRMAMVAMTGLFLLAMPALSAPPPSNSMPLSQITQMIEQRGEVACFDEVEWDNNGYWKIEYYARDGSER